MNELVGKTQEEQDIDDAAGDLLSIFEFNSEHEAGAYLVTDDGLERMSDYFGTVLEERRGEVFLSFLSLLYDAGYAYDAQQFLNMDPVDD